MEQYFGQIIISSFIAVCIWGILNGFHHAGDVWRERHGKRISKDMVSSVMVTAILLLCLVIFRFFTSEDGYILAVALAIGIYYLRRCLRLLEGDHPAA